MLSCFDLYRISAQLCKVKNKPDIAFGGMNMVFAGDFAQLPPVGGESVSLYSYRKPSDAGKYNGQCATIGKALWHNITHVVILRKNMRNTGMTDSDLKFRKALENMRYKACTKDDISFLNTLISSKAPGRPFIGVQPWRNAPIIVGENKYKDEINRLGCLRFSADTGQKLTNFYSDDTTSSNINIGQRPATKKTNIHKHSTITRELQEHLWELPTCSHEFHSPPVLALSIGLPIIIRHNVATELSITKGQRGAVYGWHEGVGALGQRVLEVLFVLLDNPPTPIHVPELPPNVVPLTRRKTKGFVTLKNDVKISITRSQVDILPGFSMTAHASQGQGFKTNAADLNSLSDHHAIYTALSRSCTAGTTIILQGFDSRKITGGASGQLRR
ncbi:uncharacterized protein C8R40DRAFT_1033086, partial [Lentinula edodes]|uniref:uncharacterized protein n=1 Tax=Lentinula edodes TaxID=5353 RepID=UPI001E8E4A62